MAAAKTIAWTEGAPTIFNHYCGTNPTDRRIRSAGFIGPHGAWKIVSQRGGKSSDKSVPFRPLTRLNNKNTGKIFKYGRITPVRLLPMLGPKVEAGKRTVSAGNFQP